MSALDDLCKQYDYVLPDELVALTPAEPRDSAKLLVHRRSDDSIAYDTFKNLVAYLPEKTLLVFNDTKVVPARIFAKKPTGGIVEILCTSFDFAHNMCTALANKRVAVGDVLTAGDDTLTLVSNEGAYVFRASDLARIIEREGRTPIPPYLKHTPLSEGALRERYQTIFAKTEGSVAAPTASLHFTPELIASLKEHGVLTTTVTLHVGLGTFAPLSEEALATGRLHEESYEISEEAARAINTARAEGCVVIPVGTTALRTIESAAQEDGTLPAGSGSTRLFIREGYRFRVAGGLITNFHVPKSSLMMLVAALVGRERLLELYARAIEHRFRFFSFGDGMLIVP